MEEKQSKSVHREEVKRPFEDISVNKLIWALRYTIGSRPFTVEKLAELTKMSLRDCETFLQLAQEQKAINRHGELFWLA